MESAVRHQVQNFTNPRQAVALKFDGGAGSFLVTGILCFLITAFTLGLAFPWAIAMKTRWEVEHTSLNGRRLKFAGTGLSFFGLWLKMWFLCFVTLGIYSFWVIPTISKWKAENTLVES